MFISALLWVGEEGTEHQGAAKPGSVAWLEQQGLQCHQSSRAAFRAELLPAAPQPCPRPLAQNANPVPSPGRTGANTNQLNGSARGIRAGSVGLSSKTQLSQESCRKSRQNHGFLAFTWFLPILLVLFFCFG